MLQNPLIVLKFRWKINFTIHFSLFLSHIALITSSTILQNMVLVQFTARWQCSYVTLSMHALHAHSNSHMHWYFTLQTHTNKHSRVFECQQCCSCSRLGAYLASRDTSSLLPPSSSNTDPNRNGKLLLDPTHSPCLHAHSCSPHTNTTTTLHIVPCFAPPLNPISAWT